MKIFSKHLVVLFLVLFIHISKSCVQIDTIPEALAGVWYNFGQIHIDSTNFENLNRWGGFFKKFPDGGLESISIIVIPEYCENEFNEFKFIGVQRAKVFIDYMVENFGISEEKFFILCNYKYHKCNGLHSNEKSKYSVRLSWHIVDSVF